MTSFGVIAAPSCAFRTSPSLQNAERWHLTRAPPVTFYVQMSPAQRPSPVALWSALGTVYLVWGSTYLAIAIAVETLPPLFYSGIRFGLAGLILAAWLAFRGVDMRVSRRQLAGAAIVGTLMLSIANGLVNVAERTVPSGVAALIVASIPLWIVVYR